MKVQTIREGWDLQTWERELPPEGIPIAPKRRAELASKVADAPDGQRVAITAGELRALLAAVERPKQRGARIEGTGANEGIVYRATVDSKGPRRLRTIEIEATGDKPDPRAFRVPVRFVEDQTRYVLATQDEIAAEDGSDPGDVFVWEGVTLDGIPSAEKLYDLRKQGVTAAGIAKLYDRSERWAYQVLSEARAERDDLDWPTTTRGPRPKAKTPDGK